MEIGLIIMREFIRTLSLIRNLGFSLEVFVYLEVKLSCGFYSCVEF